MHLKTVFLYFVTLLAGLAVFSLVIVSCQKDNSNNIQSAATCSSVSSCDCAVKTKGECNADPDCCEWNGQACDCK